MTYAGREVLLLVFSNVKIYNSIKSGKIYFVCEKNGNWGTYDRYGRMKVNHFSYNSSPEITVKQILNIH